MSEIAWIYFAELLSFYWKLKKDQWKYVAYNTKYNIGEFVNNRDFLDDLDRDALPSAHNILYLRS